MDYLNRIKNAGFAFILCDGSFEISPASRLNQLQRDFLKLRKDEIITELKAMTDMVSDINIEDTKLSASDHQLILDYMVAIDETDQEAIDELIDKCCNDPAALRSVIKRAIGVRCKEIIVKA